MHVIGLVGVIFRLISHDDQLSYSIVHPVLHDAQVDVDHQTTFHIAIAMMSKFVFEIHQSQAGETTMDFYTH